jgi:predicted nucleic-acid-binding Zn-ribbon protein
MDEREQNQKKEIEEDGENTQAQIHVQTNIHHRVKCTDCEMNLPH